MLGASQEGIRLLHSSDSDNPPDAPTFERAPPTTFTQTGFRRNRRGLADVRITVPHDPDEVLQPIRRTRGRQRNIPPSRTAPQSSPPNSTSPPPRNEEFGGGSTSYVPFQTQRYEGSTSYMSFESQQYGTSTAQMPPPSESQQVYRGCSYTLQESQQAAQLQPDSQLDLQLYNYGDYSYVSQQPQQTQSQQWLGGSSSYPVPTVYGMESSSMMPFQQSQLDMSSHFQDVQSQVYPHTPVSNVVPAFGDPSRSGPGSGFQQYMGVRSQPHPYTLDENYGEGLNLTNLLADVWNPQFVQQQPEEERQRPIAPIPQHISRYGRPINEPPCGTGGHLGGHHPHPRPPH